MENLIDKIEDQRFWLSLGETLALTVLAAWLLAEKGSELGDLV
jgi:hypothetical protein